MFPLFPFFQILPFYLPSHLNLSSLALSFKTIPQDKNQSEQKSKKFQNKPTNAEQKKNPPKEAWSLHWKIVDILLTLFKLNPKGGKIFPFKTIFQLNLK